MQEKVCKKECHSRSFFQRHVLPFQVPVYICRGKPLWVYLESDRYLRICFKPRAYVRWNFDHHFLKETTLRTCMYLYFTFQYTCAESFSGVACENIDKYLFFCWFFANLPSTFCVFCQLFLGGAYVELFFLVALWSFLTCKHLSCFYYFSLASTLTCWNACFSIIFV